MLDTLAELVDSAACEVKDILPLTDNHSISLEDAYQIQRRSVDRRIVRGETLSGCKLGFTSREKMQQMGVDSIIWGRLTNAMAIANGAKMQRAKYIHPRVEPELVFLMKKPLAGEVTMDEALEAVAAVAPALEIIDSRFHDFKFTHCDVVADNCSSASYVVGDWVEPTMDLEDLPMTLKINGEAVATGTSKAILDHPLNALVEAAHCLSAAGESIQEGQIILAGAATAAFPVKGGQTISVEVDQLGSCGFHVI